MATEYQGKLAGAQIDELPAKIREKQDAIVVSQDRYGNIVLENVGDSLVLMAATPSGDPMHYAYEAVGAVWNGTTGYWEYRASEGGVSDLTNEDMRVCYAEAWLSSALLPTGWAFYPKGRVAISNTIPCTAMALSNVCCFGDNVEVLFLGGKTSSAFAVSNISVSIRSCPKLKRVVGVISEQYCTSYGSANYTALPMLEEIRIKHLKYAKDFSSSSRLSKDSLLYMINNSAPSSNITIKLAIETFLLFRSDSDVMAALTDHPLVTLVSA